MIRPKEFSRKLFNVNTENLSQDSIFETIADLQKRLAEAYIMLNEHVDESKYIISNTVLTQIQNEYPTILSLNFDPDMYNSSDKKSSISFHNLSIGVCDPSFNDIKNGGYFYYCIPLSNYDLHLRPKIAKWTTCTAHYPAPPNVVFDEKDMEGTISVKGYYNTSNFRKYEGPALTLQCILPGHRISLSLHDLAKIYAHPHSHDLGSFFNNICTGNTNNFMQMWEEDKIKNTDDFYRFIRGAVKWVSQFNITDALSTQFFPICSGIDNYNQISHELFKIALHMVEYLTVPMIRFFRENIDTIRHGDYKDSSKWPKRTHLAIDDELEIKIEGSRQTLRLFLKETMYRLIRLPITVTGYPYGLSQLVEPGDHNPNRKYKFIDSGRLNLINFIQSILASSEMKFYEVLALRELAYAITLLFIINRELFARLGITCASNSNYYRRNFADALRYHICSAYINRISNNRLPVHIDLGWDNSRYTNRVLLSPRILHDICKENLYGSSIQNPLAIQIEKALSLYGFKQSDYI